MRSPAAPAVSRAKCSVWGEFVALPEAASAVRAVRRIARGLTRPGNASPLPNPLVLHGPPGTGKTLLVATLARKLIEHPRAITVRVLPARELPTPASDPDDLTDLYDCDLVAVEDVQHLRSRSVGELCRLLDRRCARKQQTVVTAKAGPAGLTRLPRRLTSRLAAGLAVALESPEPASRRALAERLAKRRGVPLAPDALDWLANQPTGGGVRPLIGMLERLRTLGKDTRGEMTAAAVRKLLRQSVSPGEPDPDPVRRIVARVAAALGVKPKDVIGPSRLRAVMQARQVAMYLAREVGKLSLPRIGAAFGRDHSTVLHAVRKVEAALKDDPKLRATVRALKREVG